MGKLNQIYICYVCGTKNNCVIFGGKIIEIGDSDTSIDAMRRQLAKDMKAESPDICWDEATIMNFRPTKDFLEDTEYLHISYVCKASNCNDIILGDSIIRLGGDDVTLDTIHDFLSHIVSERKPDVKWAKPTIIDLQPIPMKLALQLNPELRGQDGISAETTVGKRSYLIAFLYKISYILINI